MGILSKIIDADIPQNISKPEEKNIPAKDSAAGDGRPSAACPAGHPRPYGLTWWLDVYGVWRCLDCFPPASMALIREEVLIGNHAGQAATVEDFRVAPGFEIVAVFTPGGEKIFSPDSTLAERRQAVDGVAWFDRSDARERRAEESAAEAETAN